jgi:two-component system sensor histidine kinase PhoQ
MLRRSLTARMALAAGLVLAVFIVLVGVALERALRDGARNARQERLQAQVYLLLAAAEVDDGGRLSIEGPLAEPRLETPGSGLVGLVADAQGRTAWRSRSSLGAAALPVPPELTPGARRFERIEDAAGAPHFVQHFGVSWTTRSGSHRFTFAVAEDLAPYAEQLADYRRTLWGWLAAMALLLLAAQAATLRWGLRPLRELTLALARLEKGQDARLEGEHPAELQGLADNLNALLARERGQQTRYRNALADLAHSLKTPLALVRAELRRGDVAPALRAQLEDQVQRMDRVVDHQLQRAGAAGRSALAPPLPLRPLVDRLRAALAKVHADKAPGWVLDIPAEARVRIDEGDLTELLGNLLDNACKWCAHRVHVTGVGRGTALQLDVEDDGPGIDEAMGLAVLQRGVRADQAMPGHGIGLAVVRDIVDALGGELEIGRSAALGGARITLRLPGAWLAPDSG